MHYKPKKKLGQNFLVDENVQKNIVAKCDLNPEDVVLEIGAGKGELTRLIAERVKTIYALELDSDVCVILKNNLKDIANLEVINQDILKFNLSKYFNPKHKIKAIGNIPYYISTPIIEHLLKFRNKIDTIFLTVQKEFAERLVANPGSKIYGALSCFIQYYTEPKILFQIRKTSFFPQPKVDSSFVRLKIRSVYPVQVKSEELFFKIIRTAFNYRRKTLRNSLSGLICAQRLEKFFHKYTIDRDIRPEDLSLEDFGNLIKA
jgi:16S rRNA (adenine1518-N6/adenine1519-N6)-dimethyltransferase